MASGVLLSNACQRHREASDDRLRAHIVGFGRSRERSGELAQATVRRRSPDAVADEAASRRRSDSDDDIEYARIRRTVRSAVQLATTRVEQLRTEPQKQNA